MQSDELIWKTIAHNFCSFKIKTETQNFCRNEYNVSGLCSRLTCPLANSNYATIRLDAETSRLYLCIKTIERAHMPSKMWEKIRLDKNYSNALQQIDEELQYVVSEALVHKIKQRLTKLTQSLIRTRRLVLKNKPELIGIKKKVVRRERKRELKALTAARLETTIEKELLDRLRKGVYGDGILNESQEAFTKALDVLGEEQDVELDFDGQELEFEDEEEDEELDLDREFVSDIEDSSDEEEEFGSVEEDEADYSSEEDEEDSEESDSDASSTIDTKQSIMAKKQASKKKGAKRVGPFVNVEYEMETEKQSDSILEW